VSYGDFNEEGGYRATRDVLAGRPRPTAIFAANDLMALGAMTAIREEG
jgi:LacI family transcriptional regulator